MFLGGLLAFIGLLLGLIGFYWFFIGFDLIGGLLGKRNLKEVKNRNFTKGQSCIKHHSKQNQAPSLGGGRKMVGSTNTVSFWMLLVENRNQANLLRVGFGS